MLDEPNSRQRLLSYPSLNPPTENVDKSRSRFFSLSEGSLLGCISLVVASILGTTMLRFPRSLMKGNIYFLLPYLALACAINLFSCYALLKVANRTGLKTYYGIGSHLFGRGVGILCEMILVISCYNKILIYMVDISWILSFIFDKFKDLPEIFSNDILWCILIGLFIFYPLALFREISKLRFAAKFSILAAFSLVIALLVYIIIHQPDNSKHETDEEDIMNFYSTFLADMMQAFVCQFNLLQIYEELEYKNVDKGMKMVKISFGIVSAIYLFYGALGYLMLSGIKCENEFIIGSNDAEAVVVSVI
jgi:amino acid permease